MKTLWLPCTGPDDIRSITFTGVNGQLLAEILAAPYEVETISQILGVVHLAPGVRSIISIGGQDASLFQLAHEGDQWHLEAFNMNGPCASGTGSFMDQQAERLALSMYGAEFHMDQEKLQQTLDDFIALGLKATYPAPVACRCTVFTKSDMIHLQNKGESLPNIIAGLHYGNAANYISTIVGNRQLADPLSSSAEWPPTGCRLRPFSTISPILQVPPITLPWAPSALPCRRKSKAGAIRWISRPTGREAVRAPDTIPRCRPPRAGTHPLRPGQHPLALADQKERPPPRFFWGWTSVRPRPSTP